MRLGRLLGMAALMAAGCVQPAAAQTSDDFFDPSVLQQIRLLINPADWNRLKQTFRDNTYYNCDMEWRGTTISNIGIRSSGQGSRNPSKPGLRVDFNRFEEKQEFLGLRAFKLDNLTQDASGLRERLSMALTQRMGLPASRESHARLFINNEFIGLYGVVESIDKRYLERYLRDGEGHLYDYKYAFDWRFGYLGADLTKYVPLPFQPETHEKSPEPGKIEAMVRTANQSSDGSAFAAAMADYLDLRLFLTHMAVEGYLAELDGILGDLGMANFYLYRFHGKNLFRFLMWDKDNTFIQTFRPIFKNANENTLMRKALGVPGNRDFYLETMLRVATSAGGTGGWLEQEADRVYRQIRDAMRADPNKQCPVEDGRPGTPLRPCSNEDFEAGVEKLRAFVRDRYDFVLGEVFFAGYTPSAGSPSLSQGGALNAASNAAALTPGSLASVYGERLGNTVAQATTLPLPTEMGGVSILINGFSAPLLFVSPTQVNLQVPWETPVGTATLVAFAGGAPGNTIRATVRQASPGIFVVVHPDGALVNADRPALAGEALVIYATGLGPVTAGAVTGTSAPASPLGSATVTPTVTIGGREAELLFAGLTPGFVGLFQLNVIVPTGVTAGTSTPLAITSDGQTSNAFNIATR